MEKTKMVRKHKPMTDWVVVKMRTDFLDKKLVKEGGRYVEKTEGGLLIASVDKENTEIDIDPYTGRPTERARSRFGYSEEEMRFKKSGGMEGYVISYGPDIFCLYGGNRLEDGSLRIKEGDLISFGKYTAFDKLDFRSGEDFVVMVKSDDITNVWEEE